jgi:hypothetical protein
LTAFTSLTTFAIALSGFALLTAFSRATLAKSLAIEVATHRLHSRPPSLAIEIPAAAFRVTLTPRFAIEVPAATFAARRPAFVITLTFASSPHPLRPSLTASAS